MSVKSTAKKLLRMEAALRKDAQIPSDDLVFVTFALADVETMVKVVKATGRKLFVIDPDKGVPSGTMLVSRCRIDRHAAGEA